MVQAAPQHTNEIRLAMCERSPDRGGVDGVWWPASWQLRTELPDLVAVVGLRVGPVRRVLYDPTAWPPTPSRIIRGNTAISVDPYSMVARDTIFLMGSHSRAAVLFVLPPQSPIDVARKMLEAVSVTNDPQDVSMMRRLFRTFASAG